MVKEIPNFNDGVVLRAKALQTLADYIFVLPSLLRAGYGDGVVSGLEVTEAKGNIVVSSGIICVKSQLFLIDEPISIPYHKTNKTTYLKLQYVGDKKQKNFTEYIFSIELSEVECGKDEYELCRFKLQEGAKLRYIYDDFEDLCTEFDTINIINTPHSSKLHPTLNLNILKFFANEMLTILEKDILDTAFCMNILGANEPLNIEVVVLYIEIKTNNKIEEITNINIYNLLLQILKNQQKSKSETKEVKINKKRQIFID